MRTILCTTLLMLSGPAASASFATELADAWTRVQARGKALEGTGYLEGLDEPTFKGVPEHWNGHVSALRGIAALQAENTPEAAQHLQRAIHNRRLRGPLRQHAALNLGRALIAMEDAAGAAKVLTDMLNGPLSKPGARPVPGGVDPAEIRFVLARALRDKGDIQAGHTVLKTIWTHNPTSDFATLANEQLHGQGQGNILPTTPEGVRLTEQRIRTLERLYMHAEAVALRETLSAKHPLRSPSDFAAAVFKSKDYKRASVLLEAIPARSPDEDIMLALAYVRSGDPEASTKTYARIARSGNSASELASYKIGYMAFDQGQWSNAIREFKNHLSRHGKGRYADAALWFTALSRVRLGDLTAANKAFRRLEVSHPSSSLRVGAVYWQAHTFPDEASRKQLLSKLVRTWPTSGYAWFASHQLGMRFPVKTASVASTTRTLTAAGIDQTEFSMGVELTNAGLLSWARPHLETLSARGLSQSQTIELANALVRAGSYRKAQRLVRSWCGTPAKAKNLALIEACWPRPSGASVQHRAQTAGLPAYLPFAIMTAESALDPAVTSPAGARGLMQLMPFLAEEIHAELFGTRPFNEDELFDPSYNAQLGTTELTRLAEQFGEVGVTDPLPMIIAGYNGGADAVGRWVENYEPAMSTSRLSDWSTRPTADVWAEFIGYGETRKYVRRVLGYLQMYRLAYGDPDQPDQAP